MMVLCTSGVCWLPAGVTGRLGHMSLIIHQASLGLFTKWWQNSKKQAKLSPVEASGSELAHFYFCSILLAKISHKVDSHSTVREQNYPLIEGFQSHWQMVSV